MHPVIQVAVDFLLELDPKERAVVLSELMKKVTTREAAWRDDDGSCELVTTDGSIIAYLRFYDPGYGAEYVWDAYLNLRWDPGPAWIDARDTPEEAMESITVELEKDGWKITPLTSPA